MLVGLGCGTDTSCGCSKNVEEGLAGILGDLGDVCGSYPSASNYGTSYIDANGATIRLPLTATQNAAYLAAATAYNNCLQQAQGAPACPSGSAFQGGFANGVWQGSCVSTYTGQPTSPVTTTPGVFNNIPTDISHTPVQVGTCPSGFVWDGLNGLLRGLRGLSGCTPTAATLAAQAAALQAANDAQALANRKTKAASQCPAGYQWDGVLDLVTSGLSGCIPVATVTSQTTQQQQTSGSNGTGTQQTVTPAAAINTSYLLWGGLGLLGLALFIGESK